MKNNGRNRDEYDFDQIKDTFDEGKVPSQLEFFFAGGNENFANVCHFDWA